MEPSTANSDLAPRALAELRSEYWMIQKLGCGGFGKVYLIRNRESREYCAAKHQKWLGPDTQRNARREANILKRLEATPKQHIVLFKVWTRFCSRIVLVE